LSASLTAFVIMIESQHVLIPMLKEGTGVLAVAAEIAAPIASTTSLPRLDFGLP
jgi:hypothetical protein